MKSIKSLFLSIALFASFAGVHAMENEKDFLQAYLEQIQFLEKSGMINPAVAKNSNNFFTFIIAPETNNNSETTQNIKLDIYIPATDEQQTIDVTAMWSQIQNILNQNQE